MAHPRDLARLRTADQLKEENPLAYSAVKAFVPVLGQGLAARDYAKDVQSGDTLGAVGNALNFLPGYSPTKAAVAEGAAHVVPMYNAGRALINDGVQAARAALAPQGLRRAVGVNGQVAGNAEHVYDAATMGFKNGGVVRKKQGY